MAGMVVPSLSLTPWLEKIARKPWPVLVAILLLTVLVGMRIPGIGFSTSVRDLIVDDLPERQRYEAFKALFGSDAIIQVVVQGETISTPRSFAVLRSLTDALTAIPGIDRAISLPQVKDTIDPGGEWSLERFVELTVQVPIFQRYLISPDRRVSGITLILDDSADHAAVTRAIDATLTGFSSAHSGYQIGIPTVCVALTQYARWDCLHLPFYTFVIIAILLLAIFRSVLEAALPLFTVAAAGLWTLGVMAWCGMPLNMLTVIVPVLQIAVGTAYCLYVYGAFIHCLPQCADARSALVRTYSQSTFPTIMAGCTTIVGLVSLVVTPIGAVRVFSILACLGIVAILVALMTVFPCLLTLFWPLLHNRSPGRVERLCSAGRIRAFVDWITSRRRLIFILLAIIYIIAAVGILRIRVETNPLSYFGENTGIKSRFHDIYRHLSGSFPLHLQLRAADDDHFLSITALRDLVAHQRYVKHLPGVDKTISLADYLMLLNYVTNQFEPAHYRLPTADFEVRMLVNQFKNLLGRDLLKRYISEDFSTTTITLLTRLSTARGYLDTAAAIRKFCSGHSNDQNSCHVTGFGLVMSLGSRHVVGGQVWSLLITLGIVFVLILSMFLSVKIGIIALAANLFPILVSFGAMGWLGIDLSMGTCLIASIVVGLSVDDTIHYLTSYKRTYAKELNPRAAMCATLRQVGRPIVSTTIAICAGFSILIFSSFTPTAIFGLLMMLTMASALASGVVILPALLAEVPPITLEELFRIRTGGHRLQQTVPLLRGMTRFQVHRIMRAGKVQRVEAGRRLFAQGDVADGMYVVISGVFDAIVVPSGDCDNGHPSTPTRVNRLSVGDVIGEMGLLVSGTRCVSVVAAASGDVLMLSRTHLARIRRHYPRTANRLLANLSRGLTEKLVNADRRLVSTCSLDVDTGLLNRDAFLDSIEQAGLRARRFHEPMTICLLTINDEEASIGADRLETERMVCQVANVISGSFRRIDALGRFDQATLAIMLTCTTAANAKVIYDRLKCRLDRRKRHLGLTTATILCRFVDLEEIWPRGRSNGRSHLAAAICSVIRYGKEHLLVAPLMETAH